MDSVAALGQRILDQWLTYLESSHLHIYKEGDFAMNLVLHKDLLVVCYCFSWTGGSAMVLTYFDVFYQCQILGFVRVQIIS